MRKRIGFFALVFVLTLGVLSLAACGNTLGTAEGTVTDAATGEPVPNARVVVCGNFPRRFA